MSDTRMQVRLLLERAAELRDQGREIQRKLLEIFAEITRLTARQDARVHNDIPGHTPHLWRAGPDAASTSDTHM